jgi:hypothetical protein
LAVLNVLFCLYAFATTEEEFEMEKGLGIASDTLSRAKCVGKHDIEAPRTFDKEVEDEKGLHSADNDERILTSIGKKKIFAMPYVWVIASFLGVYQGAEMVAQGFIVTFLIHDRVGIFRLDGS